jgi:hypothetical protein
MNSTGTCLTANLTFLDSDSDGYRDSARQTASAASEVGMKSLNGRFQCSPAAQREILKNGLMPSFQDFKIIKFFNYLRFWKS